MIFISFGCAIEYDDFVVVVAAADAANVDSILYALNHVTDDNLSICVFQAIIHIIIYCMYVV